MAPDYPRLKNFTLAGYDKGRNTGWQALWFATQNLVFKAWWFPRRWRPALLRLFGATVGTNVTIRHNVRVLWPWKLSVGNDTWIGEGSWLLNLEPIRLGSDVCVSQDAFLCTGSHRHDSPDFRYDNAPITVEDGAWIAADALVLRGVTVGQGGFVGARAIVAHDVRAGETVGPGGVH
jgi:putative colanic acid biosynthesis acetyltransferase WcaF